MAPTKPLVFMAMPHYTGMVHAEAAKAFWLDPVDESIDFINMDHGRSLLAKCFNDMWCHALNLRAEHRITHFAMLHADLWAQRHWVKILHDELVATDADLCAAVVPIKDQDGLTSTAISADDPFHRRRLTIKEVNRLPETFDAEACGFPGRTLLANTGCWICRFDKLWVEDVRFEIRDKIVRGADGKFESLVEPEDWHFSRQIFERGGKIVCTRKVHVRHYGSAAYTMDRTTGRDIDHIADGPLPVFKDVPFTPIQLKAKKLYAINQNGYVFPANVDGWLTVTEAKALAELAKGKRVLEIGSYCGRSTICLASTAERVLAVDPHDGRGTPNPRETYETLRDNLASYGVSDKVTVAFELPKNTGYFGLIFIDGAHDVDSVRKDIRDTLPRLAKGGLLAFHDYRLKEGEVDGRWDPGVTEAVNELLAKGAKLVARHDTIAVVDPSGVVA